MANQMKDGNDRWMCVGTGHAHVLASHIPGRALLTMQVPVVLMLLCCCFTPSNNGQGSMAESTKFAPPPPPLKMNPPIRHASVHVRARTNERVRASERKVASFCAS